MGRDLTPYLSMNQSACLRQLCSHEWSSCGFADQAWSVSVVTVSLILGYTAASLESQFLEVGHAV